MARLRSQQPVGFQPPVDILEEEGRIQLAVDLPGMSVREVEVELNHNVLTVRGERQRPLQEESWRSRLGERRYGPFERAFVLPQSVDPQGIEATMRLGVLTLSLPKRKQAVSRTIDIAG